MSILAAIGAGALGKIGQLAKDIRVAFTGKEILDPTKQAEIEAMLVELEARASQGQLEINMEEAKHKSIFVSGWRPAVGWTCCAAFAYTFVAQPFLVLILRIFSVQVELPALPMGPLMTVLLGILGLGGMRSWEKKHRVQGNH